MKEIMEILAPVLGEDLAKDIIAHRNSRGRAKLFDTYRAQITLGLFLKSPDPKLAAWEYLNREAFPGRSRMSIKLSEDEQAGFDVLREVMPEDLAIDIVKHRRRKKAHITARIARSLVREYKAYGNVEKAAELHLTRGWISFECEWARPKGRTFHDTNNPMPAQSANYGRPEPVTVQEPISPEEAERRRQMVARLRAEGVIGRTVQ